MILPITVHILYQRDFSEGLEIYTRLYKLLCRDYKQPFNSGIDIPVYYHTDEESGFISKVDTTLSEYTYILLLIDQNMYLSDTWKKYINEELLKYISDDKVKIYPVGLYKYAFELSSKLSKNQFVGFNSNSLLAVWIEFETRLFDTLIRFVQNYNKDDKGHPIRQQSIFISHAKKDGKLMAESLRDYLLQSGSKLSSFFDVNSIMEGYNFENQLLDNVRESLMIVIFTSAYSSREWCIKEIMKAKEEKRPIVAVYAVEDSVDRVFPYIGNIPAIAFKGDWLPVINLLLKTTLNQLHQKLLLKAFKDEKTVVMETTPDAYSLSYISERPNNEQLYVIYPEPPIGKDEMKLLQNVRGGNCTTFYTPMQYKCMDLDFRKRNIAISISDSDDQFSLGIGQEMLKDVTIEIIRHIFIANGKIVYGGNIQENGYTELFRELSLQYSQYRQTVNKDNENTALEDERYVTSFISWPYHVTLTRDDLCMFRHSCVDLQLIEPGHNATEDERKNGLRSCSTADEKQYVSAALTKMRSAVESFMAQDQDGKSQGLLARIFIGGKSSGYKGNRPGLIEEFLMSLGKRPIILIGGFGGVTRSIWRHILKEENNPFLGDLSTADLQCKNLSEDDIKILKDSTNILEIVPLVLRLLKDSMQ